MKVLFLSLAVVLFPLFAQAQASAIGANILEISLTPTQTQRAQALGEQLRCLVCQNENIQDSSAALATQLRLIIRQEIARGASDQQIKQYMVKRYGIFILLKPPLLPLTWLLYASPFLALLVGGGVFFMQRRQQTVKIPPLTKAQQARLDELLK